MPESRESNLTVIALTGAVLLSSAVSNMADQFSLFRLMACLVMKVLKII